MGYRRMERERKTIGAMVRIYCGANHRERPDTCPECRELIAYAMACLDRCPFQEKKPTCSKCSIHCYRPDMRSKIREVMRFSGPRMLVRHPVLAVGHLMDSFKRSEERPGPR